MNRRQQVPTMRRYRSVKSKAVVLLASVLLTHAAPALELKATSEELRAERRWLKDHLLDCRRPLTQPGPVRLSPSAPEPGLDVLANNDAVVQNARGSHRRKIGDKEYSRGLYCHAVSKVAR